jgi:hypothetical protein
MADRRRGCARWGGGRSAFYRRPTRAGGVRALPRCEVRRIKWRRVACEARNCRRRQWQAGARPGRRRATTHGEEHTPRVACRHDDGAGLGRTADRQGDGWPGRRGGRYAGCRVTRHTDVCASQSARCSHFNSTSPCSQGIFSKFWVETSKSVDTKVLEELTFYKSCKGW